MLIIVLVVTAFLTGFLGMGIERLAYRPLRNAPRLIPLITAIGISFVLQDIVRFIAELTKGNYIVTGPSLFTEQVLIKTSSISSIFNDASIKTSFIIVLVTAVVMMIGSRYICK